MITENFIASLSISQINIPKSAQITLPLSRIGNISLAKISKDAMKTFYQRRSALLPDLLHERSFCQTLGPSFASQ
jgi:hypothetical protein